MQKICRRSHTSIKIRHPCQSVPSLACITNDVKPKLDPFGSTITFVFIAAYASSEVRATVLISNLFSRDTEEGLRALGTLTKVTYETPL